MKNYPMQFAILISIVATCLICCTSPVQEVISGTGNKEPVDWQDKYVKYSSECESKLISADSVARINRAAQDSLVKRNHDLQDSLFLKKAQIANCKKYVRICIKNSSQDQFLKGWLIRALDL